MRTPAVMIIGLVLPPCGLVLTLTSTLAPDWREVTAIPGRASDLVEHQGIWDICEEQQSTRARTCGLERTDYFRQQQVTLAKGMMISSMVVTLLGIALASLGVRCWQDLPSYRVAGLSGLIIFASGLLSLIPLSWYNFLMGSLAGFTAGSRVAVGYSLVLGYIGSFFQLVGGFSMALSLVHTCQEYLRGSGKPSLASKYYSEQGPAGNKAGAAPYRPEQGSKHSTNYSVHNSNYRPDERGQSRDISLPWSYNNPMDVTEGEQPNRGSGRSQLSSLPCDSDLL